MDSVRASLLASEIDTQTDGQREQRRGLSEPLEERGREGGRVANVSGGGGRRRSTHTYTLTNEEAGAGERGRGRGRAGQRRRRRREQRPSSRLGQGRRRRPRAGRACRDKQTSDMSKTSTFAAGCGSQFLSLLRLMKSPSSFGQPASMPRHRRPAALCLPKSWVTLTDIGGEVNFCLWM